MTNKILGAGIIAIDLSNGKILLGRRGWGGEYANTYAPFGGTYDPTDEHPKVTAEREFREETKCSVPYKISKTPFDVRKNNHVEFYMYIGLFDSAFEVQINDENLGYGWFDLDNLPENLLPGFEATLNEKKEDLIKIINSHKKQIQENYKIISETQYNPRKPESFEFHDLGKEYQYYFTTTNENSYVLSIKNTCLFINYKKFPEVIKMLKLEDGKNCFDFFIINFFESNKNPNIESTFNIMTNRNETILLMSNVLYLIKDFIKKNPKKINYAFAADSKRMVLYKDVSKHLGDIFTIFPPNSYDKTYEDKSLILMIKNN